MTAAPRPALQLDGSDPQRTTSTIAGPAAQRAAVASLRNGRSEVELEELKLKLLMAEIENLRLQLQLQSQESDGSKPGKPMPGRHIKRGEHCSSCALE